jgi:spermidine/putrescine transport system substrate-binding protein
MTNKNKPASWRACGALLIAAALAYPSTVVHASQKLTLLIWEDYLSDAVIERWKAETGVEIQQVYFDSGDKRDEILAKPDHQIDIALTERISSTRFGARELLETLDDTKVPTLRHVSQRWRDRCSRYSLPYLWGTVGIAYRADRIATAPRSWADLLKPVRPNVPHIIMMEDHEDILIPPLILLQRSINTSSIDELKAAYELLKAQSPAVLTYKYAITSLRSQHLIEQADMALAYSGDQLALNAIEGVVGEPWRYAVPEEGTLLWVDCLSVPTIASDKALAYRFLNFLHQPEIAALNATDLGVATPNAAARALLPAHIRQDSSIYPTDEVLERSQTFELRPAEATQTRRRIISALINAHDAR